MVVVPLPWSEPVAAADRPAAVPETRRVRLGSTSRSNVVSSSVPDFGDVLPGSDELELLPQAARTTADVATTPCTRTIRLHSVASLPPIAIGRSWQVVAASEGNRIALTESPWRASPIVGSELSKLGVSWSWRSLDD